MLLLCTTTAGRLTTPLFTYLFLPKNVTLLRLYHLYCIDVWIANIMKLKDIGNRPPVLLHRLFTGNMMCEQVRETKERERDLVLRL